MVEEAVYFGVQAAFNQASPLQPDAGSSKATAQTAIDELAMDAAVEPEMGPTLGTTVEVPPTTDATEPMRAPSVVWTSWDAPIYDSVAKLLTFVACFSLPIASVPQVARAAPALPLLSLPPTPRDAPDERDHARDVATSRLAGNLVRSWLHAAIYEPKSARIETVVDAAVDKEVERLSHLEATPSDVKTVLNLNTDASTEAVRSIATQHVHAWVTDAALSVATTTVATIAHATVASQHVPASDAAKAVAGGAGMPKGSFATLQYLDDVASLAATVAQSCIDAACRVLCAPLPSVAKYSDEPEPEACATESTPFTETKAEISGTCPTALAATRAVDAWVQAALVTCSAATQPGKGSCKTPSMNADERADADPMPTKPCIADVDDLVSVARQFARAATFDAVAMLAAGLPSPSLATNTKSKETLVVAAGTATDAASVTQANNHLTITEIQLDALRLDMASQLVHSWTDAVVRAMTTQRDSALTSIVGIETASEQPPVVSVVDPPGLDACPSLPPMDEDDSMRSQVAVSILAGHLVRAWLSEMMEEVAWFTCRSHEHDATTAATLEDVPSSSLNNVASSPQPEETVDAPTPLSALATIDASEVDALDMAAHDEEVAVAFVASRLVRVWLYETCDVIAERTLASTAAYLAPLEVCDDDAPVAVLQSSEDKPPEGGLVNVAVSVLAGQVVRGWLYETMDEVAQQISARRTERLTVATDVIVTPTPSSAAATAKEDCRAADEPLSDDEAQNDDLVNVTVSILAGQLVRVWLFETMDKVVQFSARRHEHAADAAACAVAEAPTPPVVGDDARPTLSVTPVVVDEAETSDDTSVAASILAGVLVSAWVYEAMDNIIVQRSAKLSEPQTKKPQDELSRLSTETEMAAIEVPPSSVKTADMESDDISDACRIVATSVMAGRLVRIWVYDVMDNIVQRATQQLASPHDVVDDAPLASFVAVSMRENPDDNSSEESQDGTVAMSILAGQLVRAWTYTVMDEIVQLTARRHELTAGATSSAIADTVIAETTNIMNETLQRVPSKVEEARAIEPSASEMDEINRAVVASMLSGQLVRGWLYEASVSCVAKQLVLNASATPPSLIDVVDALPVVRTHPTQGLYANVASHFGFAAWQAVLPLTASADNLSGIDDGRDSEAPPSMPLDDALAGAAPVDGVPSMSELQRLPVDVFEPLPASKLPDVVKTTPTAPLWRVDSELSLPIDDAIAASLVAGQLVRVWLHEAVSSVATSACEPSQSTSLIDDASAVSVNENAPLTAKRPDTPESHEASSSSAVDPTLCALLSRHLLSAWLTESMEVTAADAVHAAKVVSATYDQAQGDSPPVVPSVALPASVPVPPAPPATVTTPHTALVKTEQTVATTLVHQWLVDALAKVAVDDATLESSDSEATTSYVSSSDSRSSLSSYSSASTSSYGSSSLSSSKTSSVSDLHASSITSSATSLSQLDPLDDAS
ncbi:hypothetical protein SDRG_05897 [Saprolegnia diclina VS20]|uniref:Uncharacterized protein n=1 Tax=Saprolegnia diclina (strain VS20) TaxID=1156394 RepID=T0QRB2_SAPDV|nr:hypothetical protein SDRG_05897 [Saprolegnia diclina VS20]EQC36440.1 hypothetical protein SDRG_05897 [Saprolegnia diclina VS20]|eukprot:XP_008609861.1 hypothetical protein SDRG_05897 [Saprolegnia diclina VS20]